LKLEEKDIAFIRQFFADKPVKRAYLFGSHSRDEAAAESDIDILVELDYNYHIGLSFFKMQTELEQRLKKKVDLVSYHSLSKRILPFVDSDKKLIYEK
jgi:predicted nucleotidyltransferase